LKHNLIYILQIYYLLNLLLLFTYFIIYTFTVYSLHLLFIRFQSVTVQLANLSKMFEIILYGFKKTILWHVFRAILGCFVCVKT